MKKCRICEMAFRDLTVPCPDCGETSACEHHTEQPPFAPGLCLGCWVFLMATEKFIFQKTGRSIFSLRAEEDLRQIIAKYSKKEIGRVQIIRR